MGLNSLINSSIDIGFGSTILQLSLKVELLIVSYTILLKSLNFIRKKMVHNVESIYISSIM